MCKLDIYSMSNQHLHTLPVHVSQGDISVCSHPSTDWFAVVDCYEKTLDIYSDVEHHTCRIKLGFEADSTSCYSMTATDKFMFICHWMTTNVSVYNWNGTKMCTYPVGEQGLVWNGGVNGVDYCGNGILQVATGTFKLSLHVYTIE